MIVLNNSMFTMEEKGFNFNHIIFQPVARKQLFEMCPKIYLTDILVKFGLNSSTTKKLGTKLPKATANPDKSEAKQLFSCHLCKEKDLDQTSISKHIASTHGSSCSVCGKQYSRSKAFKLIRHWKLKHSDQDTQTNKTKISRSLQQKPTLSSTLVNTRSNADSCAPKTVSVKKPEQVFTCVECSLTFESLSGITKHMLADHEDRKHKSKDDSPVPAKCQKVDHTNKGPLSAQTVSVVNLSLPEEWDAKDMEQEELGAVVQTSGSADPLVNLKLLINSVKAAPHDTEGASITADTAEIATHDNPDQCDDSPPKFEQSKGRDQFWEELKEKAQGESVSKSRALTLPHPQKIKSKSSNVSAKEDSSKLAVHSSEPVKSKPAPGTELLSKMIDPAAAGHKPGQLLKSVSDSTSAKITEPMKKTADSDHRNVGSLKSVPHTSLQQPKDPFQAYPNSVLLKPTKPHHAAPATILASEASTRHPKTTNPVNSAAKQSQVICQQKLGTESDFNAQVMTLRNFVSVKSSNSVNAVSRNTATKPPPLIHTSTLEKLKMSSSVVSASSTTTSSSATTESTTLNPAPKAGSNSHFRLKTSNSLPRLHSVAASQFEHPCKDTLSVAEKTQAQPIQYLRNLQDTSQAKRRHPSDTHYSVRRHALADPPNPDPVAEVSNSTIGSRTGPASETGTQSEKPAGAYLLSNEPYATTLNRTLTGKATGTCLLNKEPDPTTQNHTLTRRLSGSSSVCSTSTYPVSPHSHHSTNTQYQLPSISLTHNQTSSSIQQPASSQDRKQTANHISILANSQDNDPASGSGSSTGSHVSHPGKGEPPRLLRRMTLTTWRCRACNMNLNRTETKYHLLHYHRGYLRSRLAHVKTHKLLNTTTKTELAESPTLPQPKQAQLTCSFCGVYTSTDSGLLADHIVAEHMNTFIRKCDFCDYESLFSANVQSHIDTHHKWRFCDMCHFKTRNHVQLIDHVSSVHLGLVD